MPVRIKKCLPAIEALAKENIRALSSDEAFDSDVAPLHIPILNLMPTKEVTEVQLLRLLANSPLPIDVTLLRAASHVSKNTGEEYLSKFYKTFDDIKDGRIDGLIITGAPVEKIPFEDVDYWDELCGIMDFAKKNIRSTLYICWGAQAGLYHHYGIQKYPLERKLSGIYSHDVVEKSHPLMRGFDDSYNAPHSRYTEVRLADVEKVPDLVVLGKSEAAGLHITASRDGSMVFLTGHGEYDRDTLKNEYIRDVNKGIDPDIPFNYFPDDDVEKTPPFTWRSAAHMLVSNWVNYFVDKETL